MKSRYEVSTEGAVALAANTPKTIIGAKSHANFGLDLVSFSVSFDGVTATAVPVLVELGYCTFASNAPGTGSTSTTPKQVGGRPLTAGFTSGKTWTSEPTTITVLRDFLLTPNGGVIMFDFPLGTSPDSALGEGFVIRCNAPGAVNVRATMGLERC